MKSGDGNPPGGLWDKPCPHADEAHSYVCKPCADAEIARLRAALENVATFKGKTLIGDGRYDEGANAAFEECAGLAASALRREGE